jgi:NADH-quinone oxidoreductase subunit J
MTGFGGSIAFGSLAAITLVSAFFVVQSRNIAHAGYWLLPCFIGIAGLFATLEAHFLFVAQLLVYAGAILVLILFVLMLTRDVMDARLPQTNRAGVFAALACAAGAAGLASVYLRQPWPPAPGEPAAALEQTAALGQSLIGTYAVPFEAASLILVAALIGAVVLARSAVEEPAQTPPLSIPATEALESEAVVEDEREVVEV